MSSITVKVVALEDVRPHGNADALELATIGGWQVVVRKGAYVAGTPVVYFEQGTTLPREWAERFGVVQYLSEKTDIDGERVLVVHRTKLRGEPSFGLVATPEPGMAQGDDVTAHYGAGKYRPPVKVSAGDAEPDHPRFPAYTDIENLRSHADVLQPGERVVATEKLHGTNCRVGFVEDEGAPVLMAGSRTLRRRRPPGDDLTTAAQASTYWFPWSLPPVLTMLRTLYDQEHTQVVLYGEVYGKGVQSYDYGQRGISFRAFDLMIDGRYVDYERFVALCDHFGVERVPPVYEGPFSLETIKAASDGPSLVGGPHGREGVVVRPLVERHDPGIGRVVLKYIGDSYLFSKQGGGKDDSTDQ